MKSKVTSIPLINSAAAMLRDFLDDYSLTLAKLAAELHISPQLLNEILVRPPATLSCSYPGRILIHR